MKVKGQNQKKETLFNVNVNGDKENLNQNQLTLREIFIQKILNLQVLRDAKSSHDLVKKQHRLQIAKKVGHSKHRDSSPHANESIQFHKEIQKIKQKFMQKLKEQQKIDLLKQKDLKSRQTRLNPLNLLNKKQSQQKNVNKNKNNNFQQGSTSQSKSEKQKEITEMRSPSYNYFNYGQRVPLIQDRHNQFKHFKDISDPHHIPLIMRYITAFLNSQGGRLLIGIDDSSYVYGAKFSQSQYDKFLLNIDKQGKFGMNPPLMPQKYQIRRIPVNHQKRGQQRWVIQIKVHPDLTKPKKITTYNRRCYMRMNASNHQLDASDLLQYLRLNHEDTKYELQKQKNALEKLKNQEQQSQITNKKQQQKKQNLYLQQSQSQCQSYLNKLSLIQLQQLKKQYQQKFKKICGVYVRRQRQTR